jgi:ParB family chromosome partitioning protein
LALGTKVDLKQMAKGRGRITFHFTSHEEFDRLRAILSGQPDSFPKAI